MSRDQQHGGRDAMDVDGQTSQERNTQADTEEDHIEAQAQAEMHELRNMLDHVGRRDFLEGLFTLLKALNSLIGYMKSMNRHVGKIDEEISNNTKLLKSLDEKLNTLLENKAVDTKSSPNVFQGSCSQHASAPVNQTDTTTATPDFGAVKCASRIVGKDAEMIHGLKKNLDMCVDLTNSDDDELSLNEPLNVGLTKERGGQKSGTLNSARTPIKVRKNKKPSRGKDVLKELEVKFEVSESDSDDCTIVDTPNQSTRKSFEGKLGAIKEGGKVDIPKDKGKQISQDQTPSSRPRQMPRAYISPTNKKARKIGHILPKEMDSKFRPTEEMLLTIPELKICAYTFQLHGDPREELFKLGSAIGTREQFQTLCPDHVIDNKIIEFMATKLTWNQLNTETQPAWILPPRFSEAVLKGTMAEDLLTEYASEWMPAFESLKYIYVPILEDNGHWYLMVASMDDCAVYLVDSYLSSKQTAARRKAINTIGKTIGRMMFSSHYPHNYLEGNFELGTWDIEEAMSSEDFSTSTQHSTICTLEWMQMDDVFMSNLLPRVEDKLVRMKAAMRLLSGPHNEHYDSLIAKSNNFWANQNVL